MSQPDEQVTMRHPETGGVTETSREAFDAVWSEKGWQLVGGTDAALLRVTGGKDLDALRKETKAVVADVAERMTGEPADPHATKDQLLDVVKKGAKSATA